METRKLGSTGLDVSVVGMGCAQLGTVAVDYGVRLVRRAVELGVTYLDTARAYRDSEVKIGLALEGLRDRVVLSTKTHAKTRDEAWQSVRESLERLRTDHVENCHLHGLRSGEDLEARLADDGPLGALVEAKEQGLIGHIGCTSHRTDTLIEALKRYPFETILVPMNVVEPTPLDALVPLCQARGVGVTIMKPLATGLLPAPLALKWLRNQPIASAVPGTTTIEQLEENVRAGEGDASLGEADLERITGLREYWAHRRCRICQECEPCPQNIRLPILLGTDVMYDHYRTLGTEGFGAFEWSPETLREELERRQETIASIESCDDCGRCEEVCPYGLPVRAMLRGLLPAMREMVAIYERRLAK